jgi:predicted dehydrogenase
MKSLVIGLGIGSLYKSVLESFGAQVVTVDSNPQRSADYLDVDQAIAAHQHFDTAHICTPNFTHAEQANKLASHARLVFVEKPGVKNSKEWRSILKLHPNTRFMMVKNNQWRDNIDELADLARSSKKIKLCWINKNRIPYPGSWFTNKALAFGGVSRDLLPHLLSYFIAFEPNYEQAVWLKSHCWQQWRLQDLTHSDYGVVDHNGVYNVDDRVELSCTIEQRHYEIIADWRSNKDDDIAIYFDDKRIQLDLCPESAYATMIETAVRNLNNDAFWQNQTRQDMWIHNKIKL